MLVLAGPGTGKTTVLALRILFLLESKIARKNEILAVTFTTKAAGEMRDRLSEYGLPKSKHPWIATLHSVAARILHEHADSVGLPHDFLLTDNAESRLVLNDASAWVASRLNTKFRIVRASVPRLRHAFFDGSPVSQLRNRLIRLLYKRYHDLLRFYHASDFDALLIHALTILHKDSDTLEEYQARARFLLVDEYQDINGAQHQLLKLIAGKRRRVFAVGDDDQSIYGWRGGSPRLILDFAKSFSGSSQITLTISQRCPGNILSGAMGVIGNNKNRIHKNLKSLGSKGKLIRIVKSKSENAEAKWIGEWIKEMVETRAYSASDITVLSTDPTIADFSYREVLNRGIEAVRRVDTPLNSPPVRTLVSFMRTIVDQSDNLAIRRSLEQGPIKGIGQKAIDKLLSVAERKKCSIWEILLTPKENGLLRWGHVIGNFVRLVNKQHRRYKTQKLPSFIMNLAISMGIESDERIEWLLKQAKDNEESRLEEFLEYLRSKVALDVTNEASDHQAENAVCFQTTYLVKGLEAKVVFVIGLEEGLFPDPAKDLEEQRRLFYVAMTRAKSELYLCTSRMRKVRGLRFYRPSSFIAEIPLGYTRYIKNS